jgi:WD40 repeat protein/tRNA A-37 threonylcarbamoyl transferase component Bud32
MSDPPCVPPTQWSSGDGAEDSSAPPIPPPTHTAPPLEVPGYEILGELGRGGMGVVYKARDCKLNRTVALKMVLTGAFAAPEDRLRFLTEAQHAAALHHPNIVQVHEIGEHRGLPWFTLEYLPGGSLAGRLRGQPLAPRDAAAVVEKLALGVQEAHEHGIIHRDLKPANVLLEGKPDSAISSCTPKVTDFGLARRLEISQDGLTPTGAIVGTPSYMAPEQAAGKGKEAGPAADVYALGAILYECLTARAPFAGPTPLHTLTQVLTRDPVAVRYLQNGVPLDLETICLKCLRKEPARRYTSASDLADDLRAFLHGRPIRARPVGRVERGWMWCRRNPVVATLLATLLVVFLSGFAGVTWKWREADFERGRATDNERLAVAAAGAEREQRHIAEGQRTFAELQKQAAEQAQGQATASAQLAQTRADDAEREKRNVQQALYFSEIGRARREWLANNVHLAEQILDRCEPALRGWEWGYLHRLGHTETLTLRPSWGVSSLARNRNGRILAAGLDNGRVDVFLEIKAGVYLPPVLEYSFLPKGEFETGLQVSAVALSPDGSKLAAASQHLLSGIGRPARDPEVKVWTVSGIKEIFRRRGRVSGLAFSPNGELLALANYGGSVTVVDLSGARPEFSLAADSLEALCVAFSPDGRWLATGGIQGEVRVWDLQTHQAEWTFSSRSLVHCLAFSPDGSQLASGGSSRIDLWDTKTKPAAEGKPRPLLSLQGHTGKILALAFSPDNPLLASASSDRTIKLWDLGSGDETQTLRGHEDGVTGVLFTPDGKQLISAGGIGDIKFWNPHESQEALERPGQQAVVTGDGRYVATLDLIGANPTAEATKRVHLWYTGSGMKVRSFDSDKIEVYCIAFSPDGKRLAAGGRAQLNGAIRIWDTDTGQVVLDLEEKLWRCQRLAFSPDGRLLAAVSARLTLGQDSSFCQITLWDMDSGKVIHTLGFAQRDIPQMTFSPDGKILAIAGDRVHLLDVRTGQEVLILAGSPGCSFSADGQFLLTTGGDRREGGKIRAWKLATGELAYELTGHSDTVAAAAFSPDGKRIASGGSDRTVRLWDTASRVEILTLNHPSLVTGVSFSNDGSVLIASGNDVPFGGSTMIWQAARPQPAGGKQP